MKAAIHLLPAISHAICQARTGALRRQTLFLENEPIYGSNHWLFFIKPEITQPNNSLRLDAVLDLILSQLDRFQLRVHSVRLLSADYLKQYQLINQHYGVIDAVASQGVSALSETAREQFLAVFGESIEGVKALGGLEVLEQYPFFNAHSLDCLWQNGENTKLASGTYVEKLRIDLETIYTLNGFHPRQLEHFTEPGRSIVTLSVSGDLPWRDARRSFIGATNPLKAEAGSLRRLLLEQKSELGLPDVSQSCNGVHLSAGPVEALVELLRFESDGDAGIALNPAAFPFGQQLREAFGSVPESLLRNNTFNWEGHLTSVFDLTEELDADAAIGLLKRVMKT